MDLRSVANGAIQTVNSDVAVTVIQSNGYTIDANTLKQVPAYIITPGFAQFQALDGDDLKQVDNMNLQGSLRTVFLRGVLAGVVRPENKGGDLIRTTADNKEWLVAKVMESWPTWTKVVVVLQGGA